MGSRSSGSQVLAVANLAVGQCRNVMLGTFSNPNGGILSVPVKKIRTSSTEQPVFPSVER